MMKSPAFERRAGFFLPAGFDVVWYGLFAGKPAPTVGDGEHRFYVRLRPCGSGLAREEACTDNT
jgi:hypothetical protein